MKKKNTSVEEAEEVRMAILMNVSSVLTLPLHVAFTPDGNLFTKSENEAGFNDPENERYSMFLLGHIEGNGLTSIGYLTENEERLNDEKFIEVLEKYNQSLIRDLIEKNKR